MVQIEYITDLSHAREIWLKLSPNETLFDEWEFRSAFHTPSNVEIDFRAAYEDDRLEALLPLQRGTDGLEFFGGGFMERNRVFLRDANRTDLIEALFRSIDEQAALESMSGTDPFTSSLEVEDQTYFLELNDYTNASEAMKAKLKPKSRETLFGKLKDVEALGLEERVDHFEDLDALAQLNKKRFGEESSFYKPHRLEIYKSLTTLDCATARMLSYTKNGEVVGASFALAHGPDYIYMNSGTDVEAAPNLGTYAIMRHINLAIEEGCSTFEALLGDLGWKARMHLTPLPQYRFILP